MDLYRLLPYVDLLKGIWTWSDFVNEISYVNVDQFLCFYLFSLSGRFFEKTTKEFKKKKVLETDSIRGRFLDPSLEVLSNALANAPLQKAHLFRGVSVARSATTTFSDTSFRGGP